MTSELLSAAVTHRFSRNALYSRVEYVDVETEHLLFPGFVHVPHPREVIDPLTAVTIGGVRDLAEFGGFTLGIGGDFVFYKVPKLLEFSYGETHTAFHAFVRLRIPANMGRMWGATMAQPMPMRR